MLLAIDLGNSNITIGVFDGENLILRSRISAANERSADEYAALFYDFFRIHGTDHKAIDGSILCSVVPSLTGVLSEAVSLLLGRPPMIVGPGTKTGFRIKLDDPSQLGADLAAIAAAAWECCHRSIILIDAGTVTTIAAIDKDGSYLGGVLLPGIYESAQTMKATTALLPSISLQKTKEPVIGRNTADAMRLGLLLGSAMMVDGFIDRFLAIDGMGDAVVLATGGAAPLLMDRCTHPIVYDRDLSLKGLYSLYQRNTKKHSSQ